MLAAFKTGQSTMNTPKLTLASQNVIAETMLAALHARAVEQQQPAPLVRDATAVQLVSRIDYDWTRLKLQGQDQVFTLMRVREFDQQVQAYLARHSAAIVVHIGCGLDSRFERVDDGRVTWYDLDLPEVIALRRQLLAESGRCHFIGCSVFDESWLEMIDAHAPAPVLFIAEGVFPYFTEAQVKSLFLKFMERFPGAELVCDAMTPLMLWLHDLQLRFSKVSARLQWGLRNGREPESWSAGIHLLDEWFYFDRPEPRLGAASLMRYFPPFGKGVGIYHYRLGNAVG